jgi:hypothetical protein
VDGTIGKIFLIWDGLKKGSNIENGRFTATVDGGLPSFGAILATVAAKRKDLTQMPEGTTRSMLISVF